MQALVRYVDRLMQPILKRIVMNRWNYTEEEYQLAGRVGFFDVLDLKAMSYWIKAEPICSSHCSGCHNEGRPLYFNALGLLIRHKCPPFICIHGLSQISPAIYSYYDHMLRRRDPNESVFRYITCTDIGLEPGGLGNNLFRLTYEKMPVWEFLRFMLTMSIYLFIRNEKARGNCFAVRNAPVTGGPPAADYRGLVPLTDDELKSFLVSGDRVRRLEAIEKFKDYRIIIRVVKAEACIAGHQEGDEFVVDARGVLEPRSDGQGICMMALHKIWGRVMLMLERMIEAEGKEDDFTGSIFNLPMNCFGAGLPLGSCGEILMRVEVRKIDG
jgi:uncharacterized repeat protein (TIGR04076 family)